MLFKIYLWPWLVESPPCLQAPIFSPARGWVCCWCFQLSLLFQVLKPSFPASFQIGFHQYFSLLNSIFISWIYFLASFSCLFVFPWNLFRGLLLFQFFEYMRDCSFEFFVYNFIWFAPIWEPLLWDWKSLEEACHSDFSYYFCFLPWDLCIWSWSIGWVLLSYLQWVSICTGVWYSLHFAVFVSARCCLILVMETPGADSWMG